MSQSPHKNALPPTLPLQSHAVNSGFLQSPQSFLTSLHAQHFNFVPNSLYWSGSQQASGEILLFGTDPAPQPGALVAPLQGLIHSVFIHNALSL